MRITSGIFRGRRLISPNSELTHPMGDREKLALFNSLASSNDGSFKISGATVLDLFAGSGALGLEALSRGASQVDFVENSHKAVKTIKSNVEALEVLNQAKIFSQNVEIFLDYALTEGKIYDLILIDPSYDKFSEIFRANSSLAEINKLLASGGKLVLSHPGLVPPANLFKGLEFQTSRKYARANISTYEKM